MKVDIEKLDKLKRKIKVEVGGDYFLKERGQFYHQSAKKLKIPGFRPGTAPLEILEKHHGKFLKEEFLKKMLPIFYQKALEENEILPAVSPQISGIEVDNQRLIFLAELEVKPEVEVKDSFYKGIKIKDKKVEAEEIEIEKALTHLKEQIKKMTDQDLDDLNLAKWSSYRDIEGLKGALRIQLVGEKMRERRRAMENQVRSHLLKSFNVDLPSGEVERYHKELVEREIYNLRRKGVSDEDIEKYRNEVEKKLKPVASDEVKIFYILEAIAKHEKIKIGENLGDVIFGLILSKAQY